MIATGSTTPTRRGIQMSAMVVPLAAVPVEPTGPRPGSQPQDEVMSGGDQPRRRQGPGLCGPPVAWHAPAGRGPRDLVVGRGGGLPGQRLKHSTADAYSRTSIMMMP